MMLHLLRTLFIECRWPHIFFSYIKASKLARWRECTLRLPTVRKVTRGGKMKVAFLASGHFHAVHCRISLAVPEKNQSLL